MNTTLFDRKPIVLYRNKRGYDRNKMRAVLESIFAEDDIIVTKTDQPRCGRIPWYDLIRCFGDKNTVAEQLMAVEPESFTTQTIYISPTDGALCIELRHNSNTFDRFVRTTWVHILTESGKQQLKCFGINEPTDADAKVMYWKNAYRILFEGVTLNEFSTPIDQDYLECHTIIKPCVTPRKTPYPRTLRADTPLVQIIIK